MKANPEILPIPTGNETKCLLLGNAKKFKLVNLPILSGNDLTIFCNNNACNDVNRPNYSGTTNAISSLDLLLINKCSIS